MENPLSSLCTYVELSCTRLEEIHLPAELHIDQLLFASLCFFKQVLFLYLYHQQLETLAFRLFDNSVPFLIYPIISDHSWHCIFKEQ